MVYENSDVNEKEIKKDDDDHKDDLINNWNNTFIISKKQII